LLVTQGIKPSTAGVPSREQPTVWFTIAEEFEPTCLALRLTAAGRRRHMNGEPLRPDDLHRVTFAERPTPARPALKYQWRPHR